MNRSSIGRSRMLILVLVQNLRRYTRAETELDEFLKLTIEIFLRNPSSEMEDLEYSHSFIQV